jgi:hypothetical protein
LANFTRYRSGVQRVDDVLGSVQKDIEALETSAATFTTESAVDTLLGSIFSSTSYTVATMNTAPTDGSVRFARVTDGGLFGAGSIAVLVNGVWIDTSSGAVL